MKKSLFLAPLVLLVALGLTACGTTTPPAAPGTQATTTPTAQTTSAPATQVSTADIQYMTIMPGGKLAPDGKLHDSFSPADLTVMQGVPTTITVYNYDDGGHDIVSPDLNLNVQIPGASKMTKGVPNVTTFTLTASKTGDFHWVCDVPCDGSGNPTKPGSNKGYAMANDGYMAGMIHVVAPSKKDNVALTVIPGYKLGSDGKMHDTFSPADITLAKGETTTVTVYNYDDGGHDFVAKDLSLNVQIPGSKAKGTPSVTTFTVTPDKTGAFKWDCNVPCDGSGNPTEAGSNKGWAMANDGFMAGVVTVK